jgi:hypothetical protein
MKRCNSFAALTRTFWKRAVQHSRFLSVEDSIVDFKTLVHSQSVAWNLAFGAYLDSYFLEHGKIKWANTYWLQGPIKVITIDSQHTFLQASLLDTLKNTIRLVSVDVAALNLGIDDKVFGKFPLHCCFANKPCHSERIVKREPIAKELALLEVLYEERLNSKLPVHDPFAELLKQPLEELTMTNKNTLEFICQVAPNWRNYNPRRFKGILLS